jgi:hypothetical protein
LGAILVLGLVLAAMVAPDPLIGLALELPARAAIADLIDLRGFRRLEAVSGALRMSIERRIAAAKSTFAPA